LAEAQYIGPVATRLPDFLNRGVWCPVDRARNRAPTSSVRTFPACRPTEIPRSTPLRCDGATVRQCDGPVRQCGGPVRRSDGPARPPEGLDRLTLAPSD